jgi:hypothetical protein
MWHLISFLKDHIQADNLIMNDSRTYDIFLYLFDDYIAYCNNEIIEVENLTKIAQHATLIMITCLER